MKFQIYTQWNILKNQTYYVCLLLPHNLMSSNDYDLKIIEKKSCLPYLVLIQFVQVYVLRSNDLKFGM